MGSRFGRNRAIEDDSFYNAVPPPTAYPPGYDPGGGLGAYDPYGQYGSEYDPNLSIGNSYGGPLTRRPNAYGGRYAQGFNQMPSVAPWNYGNYYLGNTTMQMMPYMLNKVHQYGQIQAMSLLGNAGLLGSGFGNAGILGSAPVMPSMPMMPCCAPSAFSMPMAPPMMPCCPPTSFSMPMAPCCPSSSSFNMPMAAPMMAAATPLPVAFNPLVQGMYPMASTSPVNWMTPSSFMSALTSGPMPYRPPAFDFPSNVGMVMTIPYGTPNPLLSSPSYGGFSSPYNFGGGFPWNCCSFNMPPVTAPAPPTISYYPRPVSVPQPYPVPYPAPVAIPNVQQVPVPRPVSVVAPPIVAGSNYSSPVSPGVPLWSSQGVFTDNGFGRPAVMAANDNSTSHVSINNRPTGGSLPVYDPTDKSNTLIGQPLTSSVSNIGSINTGYLGVTPSTAKNVKHFSQSRDAVSARFRRYLPSISRLTRSNYNLSTSQLRSDPALPPILCGQLISDSGWLPKTAQTRSITSILSGKKGKRSLYTTHNGKSTLYSSSSGTSLLKRRGRHDSSSSASEYDCAICQQERDKRRLHDCYGSSTVSSLLSSPKGSRRRRIVSHESVLSSLARSPTLFKQDSYKSHRRHPTRIRIKSTTPSSKKSNSPILLRQSPIQEQNLNESIREEEDDVVVRVDEEDVAARDEEKKEEQVEKKSSDDNDSIADKSDRYASKTSLKSTDE